MNMWSLTGAFLRWLHFLEKKFKVFLKPLILLVKEKAPILLGAFVLLIKRLSLPPLSHLHQIYFYQNQ